MQARGQGDLLNALSKVVAEEPVLLTGEQGDPLHALIEIDDEGQVLQASGAGPPSQSAG